MAAWSPKLRRNLVRAAAWMPVVFAMAIHLRVPIVMVLPMEMHLKTTAVPVILITTTIVCRTVMESGAAQPSRMPVERAIPFLKMIVF